MVFILGKDNEILTRDYLEVKQASPYAKKLMIKSLDEGKLLHEMAKYLFVDVKEQRMTEKLKTICGNYF